MLSFELFGGFAGPNQENAAQRGRVAYVVKVSKRHTEHTRKTGTRAVKSNRKKIFVESYRQFRVFEDFAQLLRGVIILEHSASCNQYRRV